MCLNVKFFCSYFLNVLHSFPLFLPLLWAEGHRGLISASTVSPRSPQLSPDTSRLHSVAKAILLEPTSTSN